MATTEGKLDKNDVRKPDPFLQTMGRTIEHSASAFEQNRGAWIAAAVLVVLVVCGYVIFEMLGQRSEKAAAQELYAVEADYLKAREGFDRAKYEAMMPQPPQPGEKKEPAQPATGDLTKDYGSVVGGLEKVVSERAKTAAGAQAAILVGELYVEYKQPEKAVDALDKTVAHLDSDQLLYGLTHMLRGTALSAKGDCTQAISSWEMVVASKKNAFLHPDALLKSGVCHESLNQNDKAATVYRQVTEQFPESQAATTAKTLLKAMNAKQAGAAPAPAAG